MRLGKAACDRQAEAAADRGALMAGSILTALPVLVFFLLVQRKIVFGLTAGAVKA